MSADFWATTPGCEGCKCTGHRLGAWNLTYNLSPMLHAAGFPGWQATVGCDPPKRVEQVLSAFRDALSELIRDPAKYEAMNPPNGWGSYSLAVQVLRDFIAVVEGHPDALVESYL